MKNRSRHSPIQLSIQVRIIDHEITLQAVTFEKGYPGINDLREAQMVRGILKTDPEQRSILKKILSF